jgi:hypothetical protein
MEIIFKEEQKFNKWVLWLISIGLSAIPIWGIYKQIITGGKFGNKPMSNSGLIFFAIFIFTLIALLWIMKLETEIDKTEIRMKFIPFIKRKINWKDVKYAKTINYGFVGGWGIRIWTRYGTVYNTKGNKGLAIELKNGKKLVIGTQKEDEMNEVINNNINLPNFK